MTNGSIRNSLKKKKNGIPLWLGLLLTVVAISCAVIGGLIIDRGFAPKWTGILLVAVALAIAVFAYSTRVARKKRGEGDGRAEEEDP